MAKSSKREMKGTAAKALGKRKPEAQGTRGKPPVRAARRSSAELEGRVRALERRARLLERRAEAAEAARAELLTVVSHDLRNPLGVIMVTTTLLARELGKEPGHERQLETIKRAASEMNQIVEDLVDAANIDAGRLSLGQEVVDAASIVDAATQAAVVVTTNRSIALVKDIAAGLSPIYVDRSRVLQAISRLVGNAARFMHKGGSITIRAEPTEFGARFSVVDTGPGLSPADCALAFSRRPPAGRRACQGTGLGVYVAKGIVVAHGGEIEADAEVGQGCTISFTLPAASSVEIENEV